MGLSPLSTSRNLNAPNIITVIRIVASVFVFVALHFAFYRWALGLFILAAGTDWIDGYLARKYQLVTKLGRILDPLADKIIICGTFIFLAAAAGSRIAAWMAVVVVARELSVTVMRSFLEEHGKDFSATMPGKLKMVLQCAAAIGSIWLLHGLKNGSPAHWLPTTVTLLAWAAVISTVYSGLVYVPPAARLMSDIK
jgi:CDP-diacylglycerol--glycerol-3-phosphate 3-phosphatidyltransferase